MNSVESTVFHSALLILKVLQNISTIINIFGTSKMLVDEKIYILYLEAEETMFNICCFQEICL